jgi:hypothetical protein
VLDQEFLEHASLRGGIEQIGIEHPAASPALGSLLASD